MNKINSNINMNKVYLNTNFFKSFTPLLIGVICLHLLWPLFGSGPFFHKSMIQVLTKPCEDSWWKNILYISNWWSLKDQV